MCEHAPNREAAMVTVAENVWCDPCLAPLVRALNGGGLPTVASCCGHGTHYGSIALADGRQLVILPDFETWAVRDNRIEGQRFDDGCPSSAR